MFRSSLVLAIALSTALIPLAADARVTQTAHSQVSFTATGPAGMQIVGTSSDLTVGEEWTNIKVAVPLAKVTTGIALRDRHMHEKYLEVEKYPNAELTLARSGLHVPAAGASSDATANGTMAIHGKSRQVTIHYVAKRTGGALHVAGSVHVNMNDYGIETPSYLRVSVKPDVDIAVAFDVSDLTL